MPTKTESKQVVVKIPEKGFPKCMFFNRFRVRREDEFVLMHFGMDSATDGTLDHYACSISRAALEQNQASLLD